VKTTCCQRYLLYLGVNTCNPYQTDKITSAPECCGFSNYVVDLTIPSRISYLCVVLQNQSDIKDTQSLYGKYISVPFNH